ncbi:MAG: HNH endonuclease [Ignavibacteriales bacterium]|nr:HNH endonuclease [Ignavibacteriales bacterium]
MYKISEFEAAILVEMSPDLLRWFTSYSPKNDNIKLNFEERNGIYYYDKNELLKFNVYLNMPWDIPSNGQRPNIPAGISEEVKREAYRVCVACHTNMGELAHITPVSKTMNNHPHNLIYLCPNHHKAYDYGFKYKNLTKDEVLAYKKTLINFQKGIWRLRGNLINSYISIINLLGYIQGLDKKIIKTIPEKEFEEFFNSIIKRVKSLNKSQTDNSFKNTTKSFAAIDKKIYSSKQEHAYAYLKVKDELITELNKNPNKVVCEICNGKGWTDYYDVCPPCNGDGYINKRIATNIDFSQYVVVDCSLCNGRGRTDDYDECPACGGYGKMSRNDRDNIDLSQYDVVNCPLCNGHGRTDDYDECPACVGHGKMSRNDRDNTDFSQYDVVNCPLCNGHGRTDDYNECPACGGHGKMSRNDRDNTDLSQYDVVNCPLCNGQGRTDDYDECPACGGYGKMSRNDRDNIDLSEF